MSKKNFQITDAKTKKTYWISRSVAICVIVYAVGNGDNTYILLHKRGVGCPNENGKWSVNCGYLDFDETVKECAKREVYEETGFEIDESNLTFHGYNDELKAPQNVTLRFSCKVKLDDLLHALKNGTINNDTKSRGGEENEVESFKLLNLNDISHLDGKFAFGHGELIKTILIMNKAIS